MEEGMKNGYRSKKREKEEEKGFFEGEKLGTMIRTTRENRV